MGISEESASRYLNHVQVSVIANEKCAQVYGPGIVLASNLCTKQPNKATCQVRKIPPNIPAEQKF